MIGTTWTRSFLMSGRRNLGLERPQGRLFAFRLPVPFCLPKAGLTLLTGLVGCLWTWDPPRGGGSVSVPLA